MDLQTAHEQFRYDKKTGELFWRKCRSGRNMSKPVGGETVGYKKVMVDGKSYYCHQIVWLLHTGEWPKLVDHRNRNKRDNRFKNLRLATNSQNGINRGMNRNNASGFKGVSKQNNKFRAMIRINDHLHYLGTWDTAEKAAAAYQAVCKFVFGEFAAA